MNRKIRIAAISALMVQLLALYATGQTPEGCGGYRIEETSGKDSKGRESRVIRFISPAGRTVKTLTRPYGSGDRYNYYISPTTGFLIRTEDIAGKEYYGKADVRLSLIDAKARTAWKKTFDVDYVHKGEDDPTPFYIVISEDGSRIAFARVRGYHAHLDSACSEIIVFNRNGNEAARVQKIPQILDGFHVSIAPDGKLVAAELQGGKLFFLDVETAKYKICTRSGIKNGKKWRASYDFTVQIGNRKAINKTVWISTRVIRDLQNPNEIIPNWGGFISFDEIPEDISTFLNK